MRSTIGAAVAAMLVFGVGTAGEATDDVHWTYEGAEGPEHWADLSPAFGVCRNGMQQSPIDVVGAVDADLAAVEIHWKATAWTLFNKGHTLQLEGTDAGHAIIDGERYDLVQFHFHTPSEHTIDGERFPMEVHFVHVHGDGRLAVIGAMFEAGEANPLFDAVMAAAPATADVPPVAFGDADPSGLVPNDEAFFRYFGSLTTPPCSETVVWTLMSTPVAVAQDAIDAFEALFEMNARPLNPIARRYVLHRD